MAALATALLVVAAVIGPLETGQPALDRAVGRAADVARPRPDIRRPAGSVGSQQEDERDHAERERVDALSTAPSHLSSLRRPGATGTEAGLHTQAQGNGPRNLKLWDGEVMAIAPADLGGDAGTYRWHLPRTGLGWHPDSADCGEGVTIVGGHVSFDGLPGPLAGLAGIGPADRVDCTDADGVTHRYEPRDYLIGSVDDDPAHWIPQDWGEGLILYTCTRELNGDLLVVRFRPAEPIGSWAAGRPDGQS